MSDIDSLSSQLQNLQLSIRPRRNKMATLTFRDYIDTVPQFNGDQKLLGIFINAAQNTIDKLKIPDDEVYNSFLFQAIKNKLIGPAQAIIATNPSITWEEIKIEINRRFGDQRTENTLTTELLTLTQHRNEKPLNFGERCKDMRDLILSKIAASESPEMLAYKTTMFNNITLQTFLKGVHPEISHLLRCKSPKTLEEALQMVMEEDNYLYTRNHFININRNPQRIMQNTSRPPIISQQQRPAPMFVQPRQPVPIPTSPALPYRIPNYFSNSNQVPWNQRPQNQPPRPFINWPSRNMQPQQTMRNSNVFKPNNNVNNLPKPTPMDTSSGNTRINSNNSRKFPQRPNFTHEELYYQEDQNYSQDEYYEAGTIEDNAFGEETQNFGEYCENFDQETQESPVLEMQQERTQNSQNFQQTAPPQELT